VLVLHVYEEWTFPEIARALGCPIGTAKANFFHAVTNLRKRIGAPRTGSASTFRGRRPKKERTPSAGPLGSGEVVER
jgi:hypothetical protein